MNDLWAAIVMTVYASGLGALVTRRRRPAPRSLGAAARKPGPAWGTVVLAVVVVVAATVIIVSGREIPPIFTVVLSTVAAWIGANAPTGRK